MANVKFLKRKQQKCRFAGAKVLATGPITTALRHQRHSSPIGLNSFCPKLGFLPGRAFAASLSLLSVR
jgi:hypothetical protein